MNVIWGIILTILSSIAYFGQLITTFLPKMAVKWGVTESQVDVEPAFYTDICGEAIWDSIVLWTLPVAGVLLILNTPHWTYLGLVGGGMYLYFAGLGIVTRIIMQRRGFRIGKPESLKVAYIFLTLWGLAAIITITIAIAALPQL